MGETTKQKTRHKEYSLLFALLAGGVLIALQEATSTPLLIILNIVAIGSILYSAFSVVRHADVLAHRFGEPFGSLILSLAIVILESSLISVLVFSGAAEKTLLRDTIYSVIIIVMAGFIGLALLLGGHKYKTQYFNFTGIKHFLISIIPLSVMTLVFPSILGDGHFTTIQLVMVSVSCLALYGVFLHIQTVTHRKFFVHEAEDSDGNHGKPSSHGIPWHFAFLAVHLIAVIAVAKLNAEPLHQLFMQFNAPPALAGFLVALLILSPEGAGAFTSTLRNQMQRAMNLFLGSVLATISLTVPLVAFIAIMAGQPLEMGLALPDIVLMLTTFLVCQTSLTGGETNTHSGAAHMVLFLMYIALMFY